MSVEAIGALQEPVRRAVYERAVASGAPVSRNEIADALGIGRTLAAHHLDKLVEAGLLEASFARVNGRSGPGAGRPAKLYRRSPAEHTLSLPPRDYRMLAEMLADAVEAAGADLALQDTARRHGARVAAQRGQPDDRAQVVHLLKTLGFEPYVDGSCVRLRNCPFDAVAKSHPGLVCGASLAFVEGALGRPARLDPRPEGCCVAIEGTKNKDH
jgi:predicted ArsR family transcriptional regulator